MPFNVTEEATSALKGVLDNVEREPEQVLRLIYTEEGELSLTLDAATDDDEVITHGGDAVMVVEPPVSQQLDGAVMDVKDNEGDVSFTIRPAEETEEAE